MGNKTHVIVTETVGESNIYKGDKGFIDGYVKASDNRAYAVFIRFSDGHIDFIPVYQLRAILEL